MFVVSEAEAAAIRAVFDRVRRVVGRHRAAPVVLHGITEPAGRRFR
jgi:hypothetical protein